MCGLVGYFGQFDEGALMQGLQVIRHRGPDDEGVIFDRENGIALGHRRLSIIDLSAAGHQPMTSHDGMVTIVYNGEIYNYRELRRRLVDQGVAFTGNSDTEVLLNLYLAEKHRLLEHLNGIFAFAIWDRREKALFLARDAFGIKPLYFGQVRNGLCFSSEIKGLLPLLPDSRDLDLVSLHRYLTFLWCPGKGTPLRDIKKLEPGQALIARDGQIVRKWTWHLSSRSNPEQTPDQIAGVRETIRKAVHRQLVSDVPVGAFLSGGLDSSAVVAFAREENPDIRCFSIEGGKEEGDTDDLPYARAVARHLNVPLDVVSIDSSTMAKDLSFMVRQLDEPLADPASLNVFYISKLARDSGIKVLLSGAGGDDIFSGYRRHAALHFERYWRWMPESVLHQLENFAGVLNKRNPSTRRLAKLFDGASASDDDRMLGYFNWAAQGDLIGLYSPAMRKAALAEPADGPLRNYLTDLQEREPLEQMLALERRFFLADHNLIYTDKMSMATGVEVRVPFLDPDLVEFASHIPADLKQRGRTGKWILKKAMEPYLPRKIIYRPKTGFSGPVRQWLRSDLQEYLRDLLSQRSLKRRGLFDPSAVQQLIERNAAGRVDASYTLLSILCIEVWCREFLDAPIESCATQAFQC